MDGNTGRWKAELLGGRQGCNMEGGVVRRRAAPVMEG